MSKAPTAGWRQYWIFQANPDRYDALSELREGARVDWTVSRFLKQYRSGDVVFLWIAGSRPGIYGWGEVVGDVADSAKGKRLAVEYRGVMREPISAQSLKEQGTVFEGLTILRNPTGANFRITVLEVQALCERVKEAGLEPPPFPEQGLGPNKEEFTRAVYLLDYRYDTEVKAIIANCLGAGQATNGVVFPKLLIQTTVLWSTRQVHSEQSKSTTANLFSYLPVDALREACNFAGVIEETAGVVLSTRLAQSCLVKHTVFRLLALARRLAIHTTGHEQISLRHLYGALLHGETESFQKYMQELVSMASLNLADAQDSFVEYIREFWPDDNINAWQLIFSEQALPEEGEAEEFAPLMTRLDSDAADQAAEDFLNIDEDAIALAKILCTRDAAPPLAIGLFGEWGSGKTFFMRRMRRHVTTLSQKVADKLHSEEDKSSQAYYPKIAQIWFNAWHYQDGNLWASMVNHVFSGLKQELRRLNQGKAEEQFKELMERLDDDRVRERELQQSAEHIQQLNDKDRKLKADIASLENFQPSEEGAPGIKPEFLELLKKHSSDMEAILGLDNLSGRIDELAQNAEGLDSFLKTTMQGKLKSGFHYWLRAFTRYKLEFLIVIVAIAAPAVTSWWMMQQQQMMGSGVFSVVAVVAAWLSSKFTQAGKIVKLIAAIKKEFETAESRAQAEINKTFDENQQKLLQLKIEHQQIEAALDAAQKNHDLLNAQYGRESDESFATFVFSRAASEDYTAQLGILNTVRRDFCRLDELLREQNQRSSDASTLPRLNRIILYIDDLDRCEPQVVVEVLQAIHLMLAFPLFMVVVGVDARWLGRSLKKRYPFLVHEQETEPAQEDIHAASTHDYLEKIFQIPFWLKPLDGERARQMMKGLLLGEVQAGDAEKTAAQAAAELTPAGINGEDGAKDAEPSALFEETEDQSENYKAHASAVPQATGESVIVQNLLSTRALEMTNEELSFFEILGPVVGRSPRAVKRFVNLYRILKSSQAKTRVAGFSDKGGDFRAPLLLLAVLCGFPKEACEFFSCVKAANGNATLVENLAESSGQSAPAGWSNLHAALETCAPGLGELSMQLLGEWITPVARFSYREWMS